MADGRAAAPLPTGYYLLDFETMLRAVRSRYEDLLHPGERHWMDTFAALPLKARRLYVRMLMRKGPWFRTGELDYPEIGSPGEAVRFLVSAGFCLDRATYTQTSERRIRSGGFQG